MDRRAELLPRFRACNRYLCSLSCSANNVGLTDATAARPRSSSPIEAHRPKRESSGDSSKARSKKSFALAKVDRVPSSFVLPHVDLFQGTLFFVFWRRAPAVKDAPVQKHKCLVLLPINICSTAAGRQRVEKAS